MMAEIDVMFVIDPDGIGGRISVSGDSSRGVRMEDAESVAEIFAPNELHPLELYDYFSAIFPDYDYHVYTVTLSGNNTFCAMLDGEPYPCNIQDTDMLCQFARDRLDSQYYAMSDDEQERQAYIQAMHDMADDRTLDWNE